MLNIDFVFKNGQISLGFMDNINLFLISNQLNWLGCSSYGHKGF